MSKDFIPYEQALELKELGFDEPCFGYWSWTDVIDAKNPDKFFTEDFEQYYKETYKPE